jgi:hypothetical protein
MKKLRADLQEKETKILSLKVYKDMVEEARS